MKNIIIIGPSRTGKTELSSYIAKKLGYSILRVDNFLLGLMFGLPESDFTYNYSEKELTTKISSFINVMLGTCFLSQNIKNDSYYIIEGVYLDLDEIYKSFSSDDFIVIGLTYGELDRDEFLAKLRNHDTNFDWSFKDNDEVLLGKIDGFLNREKEFQEIYQKYNIKSYNTMGNRKEVFNEILEYINKQNMNSKPKVIKFNDLEKLGKKAKIEM